MQWPCLPPNEVSEDGMNKWEFGCFVYIVKREAIHFLHPYEDSEEWDEFVLLFTPFVLPTPWSWFVKMNLQSSSSRTP